MSGESAATGESAVTGVGSHDGRTVAPYGAWRSPLGARDAAAASSRFAGLGITDDEVGRPVVWWAESRPHQGGRVALVVSAADGAPTNVGGDHLSMRSRVNEYGGGAFWCGEGHVDWVDDSTQQLMRYETSRGPAVIGAPKMLSGAPPAPRAWRYASGRPISGGEWLVVERESTVDDRGRAQPEPRNELVVVRARDRRQWLVVGSEEAGGGDFVAAPAVSPDGSTVAWLRWDHPDMPWDAAELWAGRLLLDEDGAELVDRRRVAGGREAATALGLNRAVSVCLPEWSPDGRLWWCDDADGWWHLRATSSPGLPDEGSGDDPSTAVPGCGAVGEEIGEPRWVAGGRRYDFCGDGRLVIAVASGGVDSLQLLDPDTGERSSLPGPAFSSVEYVAAHGGHVAVIGADSTRPSSVWLLDTSLDAQEGSGAVDLRPVEAPLDPAWVSTPRSITFGTGPSALRGQVPLGDDPDDDYSAAAHALLYLPASGDHVGPAGELPPLVVRIHGGPTAAARPEFSTSIQFWTTRGFAVVDVNYRGSTGFGREYRDALNGRWGVAEVEDCLAVTRYLAGGGLVDGTRCVIRGGSAGGFTALAAVCFQAQWGAEGAFAGACSLYGVTDLAALAADTHKFESRYLDGLVAPLPGGEEVYRSRSPLHHADQLDRPVLLLQGAEDRVVPPAQARVLAEALERNGVPHRFVLYEGEGHGFQRAETIVSALQEELSFYGEVLGFEPPDL